MKRILVVYYSRSGFTRKLAKRIAEASDANLEFIEDRTQRYSVFGYLRSAVEAALHLRTGIRAIKQSPGDYDLVVIGTPIWCWNIASPARAYIEKYRDQLKWVAFFCTYGGSGQFKVLSDMESLAGRQPLATLALSDQEIENNHFQRVLSRFVAQIKNTGIIPAAGKQRVSIDRTVRDETALGGLSKKK